MDNGQVARTNSLLRLIKTRQKVGTCRPETITLMQAPVWQELHNSNELLLNAINNRLVFKDPASKVNDKAN